MSERDTKKLNSRGRKLVLLVIVLIVAALALAVFLNRDAIARRLSSSGGSAANGSGEPYTFESGTMQVYASVGDGMALASTNALQLLDSSGKQTAKESYSMKKPALTTSDSTAAAFDVGGKAICIAGLDGKTAEIDNSDTVITARMNKNGWLVVCTEATGYKGRATVYNASHAAVYRWNSGEGYLLGACLSPDNKYLAALCAGSDGSAVHIFSLQSEKELASWKAAGKLVMDMTWLEDNRLFLLSQTDCTVIDRSGTEKGSYDFGGLYLTDYSFGGDGFAVLMLGKYRTGGTGTLTVVGADCKLGGQAEIDSELLSLACNGKTVAALCQNGLRLYTQSLSAAGNDTGVAGVKSVLVRDKGDVLLISSYSAEVRGY